MSELKIRHFLGTNKRGGPRTEMDPTRRIFWDSMRLPGVQARMAARVCVGQEEDLKVFKAFIYWG